MKYFPFLVGVFFTSSSIGQTKVFDVIVANDGSGNYTYLSSAIERLGVRKRTIFIKNGIYNEKIAIDATKTNVRLIGESMDGVIFTYNDYAGKSTSSSTTADSYTFKIEADGFYAENITFQNTATQAQAVAVYSKADSVTFKNCKFLGYQDTHFADNGRQLFLNCEIKGDVDFIFGSAAAVFENCIIVSTNRKGGYVTAPSEAVITSAKPGGGSLKHGFLFRNCELKAEEGLADNSVFLGRPWGDNSSSVFLNCEMDSHIKPSGWSVWTTDPLSDDFNNHESSFFAEYNSKSLNGNALDISQRVSWSHQLESSDTTYYALGYYFKGWNPLVKTNTLPAPENVRIISDSLKWDSVNQALGYAVFCNDSILGFTFQTSYSLENSFNGAYKVKTINPYGAIGEESSLATLIHKSHSKLFENSIFLTKMELVVPQNDKVFLYDISGKIVLTSIKKNEIDISGLNTGIYIVKVQNGQNEILTKKILIQ